MASLSWNDVPLPTREKVQDHLIDTIGVMCAGLDEPASRSADETVRRWQGTRECTVVGRPWRLPAPSAAFLNAFHGRIHSFDDTYDIGVVHPGSVIVSAALAVAERIGASGNSFLSGVLAGYEVATRLSRSISPDHYARGFHSTGTCNTFGAASAAARVLGMDARATADALGLAGEAASGLRQFQEDGAVSDTALNAARAAEAGIKSVELCSHGISGPHGILDGRWGFCRVMAQGADFGALENGLGTHYEFSKTAIKPYASCRFTHGPIEVLAELRRKHSVNADEVASIEIRTFRTSIEVSDRPSPGTHLELLMSHQVAAALALTNGTVMLGDVANWASADALRSLAAKVRVIHDPFLEADYPSKWPHAITIHMRNGRALIGASDYPPGGGGSPLARGRVQGKFKHLATPILGKRRTASILMSLESLELSPSIVPFVRLLKPVPIANRRERMIDARRNL